MSAGALGPVQLGPIRGWATVDRCGWWAWVTSGGVLDGGPALKVRPERTLAVVMPRVAAREHLERPLESMRAGQRSSWSGGPRRRLHSTCHAPGLSASTWFLVAPAMRGCRCRSAMRGTASYPASLSSARWFVCC